MAIAEKIQVGVGGTGAAPVLAQTSEAKQIKTRPSAYNSGRVSPLLRILREKDERKAICFFNVYSVVPWTSTGNSPGATIGNRSQCNDGAFSWVSLLSSPHCVQLRLQDAPIDYFGAPLTPHLAGFWGGVLIITALVMLSPPRRAFGRRLLEGRSVYRPTSDQSRPWRRSCRASSTTCTAESGGNPLASPPNSPDGRAV
jgi:hypothetical protein